MWECLEEYPADEFRDVFLSGNDDYGVNIFFYKFSNKKDKLTFKRLWTLKKREDNWIFIDR